MDPIKTTVVKPRLARSILLVYYPTHQVCASTRLDLGELGLLYESTALLIGLFSNSWALLVSTGLYKAVL